MKTALSCSIPGAIRFAAVLLPILGGAATLNAQAVIYREVFGNSTGSTGTLPSVGWTGVRQTGSISSGLGKVQNLENVNAGTTASMTNGFLFNAGSANATPALFHTDEFRSGASTGTSTASLAPLIADLRKISFYQGNSVAGANAQVAVRVGTQWYVSTATYTTTTGMSAANFAGASGVYQQHTVTTAAADWSTLTWSGSGTGLTFTTVGASSALSGVVTGWGFYLPGNVSSVVRFDTFEVTAVPEPSAFGALAGLGALGFAGLRRRRRA